MSKKVYSTSVDRELKSLKRNSIHEKRLSEENKKVDMHIRREAKFTERQKEMLRKDCKVIESKSPSLDEWQKQHQATYNSWKEREREKINKQFRTKTRYHNPNIETYSSLPKCQRSLDEGTLSKALKGQRLANEDMSSKTLKSQRSID